MNKKVIVYFSTRFITAHTILNSAVLTVVWHVMLHVYGTSMIVIQIEKTF